MIATIYWLFTCGKFIYFLYFWQHYIVLMAFFSNITHSNQGDQDSHFLFYNKAHGRWSTLLGAPREWELKPSFDPGMPGAGVPSIGSQGLLPPRVSLRVQKNPPAIQETWEMQVQSLGGEDPLEEGKW